jgi:hypothetical protein
MKATTNLTSESTPWSGYTICRWSKFMPQYVENLAVRLEPCYLVSSYLVIRKEEVRLGRPNWWMLGQKREPMRATSQFRGSINLHKKQKYF